MAEAVIRFHAHCGMSSVPVVLDMAEARRRVARRLRRQRNEGYAVTTLEKGREWEITEPEDSMMVPDDAGFLLLAPKEDDPTDDDEVEDEAVFDEDDDLIDLDDDYDDTNDFDVEDDIWP